jgi:hypothetical protein
VRYAHTMNSKYMTAEILEDPNIYGTVPLYFISSLYRYNPSSLGKLIPFYCLYHCPTLPMAALFPRFPYLSRYLQPTHDQNMIFISFTYLSIRLCDCRAIFAPFNAFNAYHSVGKTEDTNHPVKFWYGLHSLKRHPKRTRRGKMKWDSYID